LSLQDPEASFYRRIQKIRFRRRCISCQSSVLKMFSSRRPLILIFSTRIVCMTFENPLRIRCTIQRSASVTYMQLQMHNFSFSYFLLHYAAILCFLCLWSTPCPLFPPGLSYGPFFLDGFPVMIFLSRSGRFALVGFLVLRCPC
jgi:hypothetical protein